MPLHQLQALEYQHPDRFKQVVDGMARQRVASLKIEGIIVSQDQMAQDIITAIHQALQAVAA